MRNTFLSSRRCAELAIGVFGIVGLQVGHARAATINAASPSLIDVTAAIASASDGDTVVVPSGTAAWTAGVTVTKGITIQGQTTTDSSNGTYNDQTILIDNLVSLPGGQGFFNCTVNSGKSLRITGVTFSGPGNRGTTMSNGSVRFSGTSAQVRIDHCHWTSNLLHSPYVAVNGAIYGVADHNVMEFGIQYESFGFYNGTVNDQYGDGSWASATNFGSSNFFFVEDNYLNNKTSPFNELAGNTDDTFGGRWVFRHNHCYDIELQTHGTETGRYRGGRARESYSNDFHYSHAHPYMGIRSGATISHDNTFDGTQPTRGLVLEAYRVFYSFPGNPWGGASGDSVWDYNDTEGNGTHVDGHSPYLYQSGTVSSGSSTTLSDNTKTWTTNQWAGFTAKRLSDNQVALIQSNTSNTLTVYYYTGGPGATWQTGDQYQIHKPLIALDQPCRGQGDLLAGNTPVNNTTGTAAWSHQALEPTYSWNDVYNPGSIAVTVSTDPTNVQLLHEGRDFFNNTSLPGYTPYTYPHPLVSGGNSVAAPQNLHVMQ